MVDDDELIEFASIPAPTGAERQRIDWLAERLQGFPGDRAVDDAGNLVWRFGADRPQLLVMAHVDTVFGPDVVLEIRRDGGDLVGPGVGDNAAAVMAVVWAIEQMDEPAGLAIAFTVAEEGLGDLRGARQVRAALDPQAVIALEGHGLDEVMIDHVGSVRARVVVTGPGGHSWWDRETPSAVHALVEIASGLMAHSANVGTISGGDSVNAVAARAELLVERRSLAEHELDEFAEMLGQLRIDPPLQLELEPVGRRPAGQTPPEHPLVAAVRRCESASVCRIGWVPDRPMPTPRWRRAFPQWHWAARVARACILARSGSICARSSSAAFRWSKSCASWPADGSPRPRPAGSAAHPRSHPAPPTGR